MAPSSDDLAALDLQSLTPDADSTLLFLVDTQTLPEAWYCFDNDWDRTYADCSVPEEDWESTNLQPEVRPICLLLDRYPMSHRGLWRGRHLWYAAVIDMIRIRAASTPSDFPPLLLS